MLLLMMMFGKHAYSEVLLGDSLAMYVLFSKMTEMTLQDEGVVEEVDQEVHAVGNTNHVGFVLGTFRAIDLDSCKECP